MGVSTPLRRCPSLRKRPEHSDSNYRETVARLRMLLADSYQPLVPFRAGGLGGAGGHLSDVDPHALVKRTSPAGLADFISRQEEYIHQLETESRYCRGELTGLMFKLKDLISENEELMTMMRSVRDALEGGDISVRTQTAKPAIAPAASDTALQLARARPQPPWEPSLIYESRISELQAKLTQARMESQELRHRLGD